MRSVYHKKNVEARVIQVYPIHNFQRKKIFISQTKTGFFNILRNNPTLLCGGCRARLKAMDLGSIPVGVRRFKSGPPHFTICVSRVLHVSNSNQMLDILGSRTTDFKITLDLYSHLAVFRLEFPTNSFPETSFLKLVKKQFHLVSNMVLQQFFHCHDFHKMTI